MSRYSKQMLTLLHGTNCIKTCNEAHSKSLDGFESITLDGPIFLNPGAYVTKINGEQYGFVVMEPTEGFIYNIGTDAVKIGTKYAALYRFKPLENNAIKNTVNASADYIVMSGMSILKSGIGDTVQSPYNETTFTSIETIEYTLTGKRDDQYDKNIVGFSKNLKSLNDKDIFLIDHNAEKHYL